MTSDSTYCIQHCILAIGTLQRTSKQELQCWKPSEALLRERNVALIVELALRGKGVQLQDS